MRKWGFKAVGILACTALMTVAMGQNVLAADVPNDGYTVSSGETREYNEHTGVVNNGTINMNKAAGCISDNGSSTNHDAFVGSNFGRVDQNYGEITINFNDVLTNESGGKVDENAAGADVLFNYGAVTTNRGIVTTNESGGTVTTNKSGGTVVNNNGEVTTNNSNGTVTNTVDTADSTHGAVGTNSGTVNTADGKSSYVGTNFGTVNGATSGGGTVTIVNNFGGTVTKNNSSVTITNNYGNNNVETGVTITNQFYEAELTDAPTNSTVVYSTGFTEANNQQWIQTTGNGATSRGTIIIRPASGYEISSDPSISENASTYQYTVQKKTDGSVEVTITLGSTNTGKITINATTFSLVIDAIQQATGGQVTVVVDDDDDGDSSDDDDEVQKPIDPMDLLRAQLTLAILQGGEQTIPWTYGTSMPLDIMQLLAEHPEVTVDFTYNFEGATYEALLNSVETDETIPWYGPLYLNDRYGVVPVVEEVSQ